MPHTETIGDRCRQARHKRGYSQKELSVRAGVSESVIGNVETGIRHSIRKLTAVANALQVNPHWLATGEGSAAADVDAPAQVDPGQLSQASGSAQEIRMVLAWLAIWHGADAAHRSLIESAFAVASSAAIPHRLSA